VPAKHSVFVLHRNGKPITPTTPCRARKLLKSGSAKPVWSRFGTFGIQLTSPSRGVAEYTALGVDQGSKFEGYSIVAGSKNTINIKLDLPSKSNIVRKLAERRYLRHSRRRRKCRRREARFQNRAMKNWLSPSQACIVNSRLKVMRELCRMFPITATGLEDVRFNHCQYRWAKNFSTVEIGKSRIADFLESRGIELFKYLGFQTKSLREKFGYSKTSDKSADKFSAHCSDSLSLAITVWYGSPVEPGLW